MEDGLASNARVSGSNVSYPSETHNRQLRGLIRDLSASDAIRNCSILPGTIDVAVIHLKIAIRATRMQAEDALGIAMEALKNLGIATIMKAAMVWMKAHPWETIALIVPVLLVACTPAFLGLAGFTAGGIAAGSIAAGIQAGIGNVAAGFIFATLTSAAMSGYDMPIVFGGVWGVSSVVCWGLAAWKKWRQGPEHADHRGHGNNYTDDEDTRTSESRSRLLEE